MPASQESTPTDSAPRCGHDACQCKVASGERFCSEYCAAKPLVHESPPAACGCQHPACASAH